MHCTIVSFSEIDRDPRVLRQLRWLQDLGYSVSFVGFGNVSGLGLENFFRVPVSPILTRYFSYLLPNKLRFRLLYGRHLTKKALKCVHSSDLVVVNELELLPAFTSASLGVPVYLDLHENHVDDAHHGIFEWLAFKRYWAWQTHCLKRFVELNNSSIRATSVEEKIASKYEDFFNIPMGVIYNSPKTSQQFGDPASPNSPIKLVHLGMARKNRGVELILRAVSEVRRPFRLDLMLVFAPVVPIFRWKLNYLIRKLGLTEVVTIKAPVPVSEVVRELSSYDISLVIGSNATNNDLNSLPNKFFQSVQAGLMIICGPNPAVKRLVEIGNIGVVLSDWSSEELKVRIDSLTVSEVNEFKKSAEVFAPSISEGRSEETFKAIIKSLTERSDK